MNRVRDRIRGHESVHGKSLTLRRWFNRAVGPLRAGSAATLPNCILALQRCDYYAKEFTIHGFWVRKKRNRQESVAFAECVDNVSMPVWDTSAMLFLERIWPDCRRKGTVAFIRSQYCKHAYGLGVFPNVETYVQAAMSAYFQCQGKGWASLVEHCRVFAKKSREVRVPFHYSDGVARFAAKCDKEVKPV